MKQINVTFTDSEHFALGGIKGRRSWHDFILTMLWMEDVQVAIKNAPDFEGLAYNEAIEDYDKWLKNLRNMTGS